MAKPIKETPFLKGKDARTFVEENVSVTKVSSEEKDSIFSSYETLKGYLTFSI